MYHRHRPPEKLIRRPLASTRRLPPLNRPVRSVPHRRIVLSQMGLILVFTVLILVRACHSPPIRPSLWQSSIPVGAILPQQEVPTVLARLPTTTPWLSTKTATTPLHGVTIAATMQPEPTGVPDTLVVQQDRPVPPIGLSSIIDAYMQDQVADNLFSGAILVAHQGKVVISKGYGMADWETQVANTPQTRIRLASLTKPFTAVAILMLHARGQLSIHDSICRYVPNCPVYWEPVTIRHLLNHSAGIPNYTDFADFEQTEMLRTTRDNLIGRFKHLPLLFEPGTLYSYSNSGYVLLGLIIERVSGQPYEIFLQSNIFVPLDMVNTGYDHNHEWIQPGQASGYTSIGILAPFIDSSTLDAAGGLYSTVEDLYRWDQALYTEQLLPTILRDEMFTPDLNGYGYGWRISNHNGQRTVSHTGMINGFSNYIVRYPDEHLTIIMLSNLQSANPWDMSLYLAQLVLEMQ